MVTVRIVSKGEDIIVDALPTKDNKYSVNYHLPEFGEYELKIKADSRISETVRYEKTEYKSTEAKMMNSNIRIAEGMLEWSKLLMEDYFADNKNYTFANNSIEDYEIITENENNYILLKDTDDGIIAVGAVYSKDGRLLSFDIAEDGVMKLDITNLSDYMIKIFRWNSLTDLNPTDKTETYLPIKQ